MGRYPQVVVPQNEWFIMEHPIKIGDFRVPRVPLFEGTSMYTSTHYTVDAPIYW